jgi:hypothetical protein
MKAIYTNPNGGGIIPATVGQPIQYTNFDGHKYDFIYAGADPEISFYEQAPYYHLMCLGDLFQRATWEEALDILRNINLRHLAQLRFPTIRQLELLFMGKMAIGGFQSACYWSHTEESVDKAFGLHFGTGERSSGSKERACFLRFVVSIPENQLKEKL